MSQDAPSGVPPAPETSRAATRLERHVEWSGGFWLAYVFTDSPRQAGLLEERVRVKLAARSREQRVLRPSTPAELETILEQVLADASPPCTWVEAVAEDSPAGDPGWTFAWTSFILRANERRELLRASLAEGLVLVAPTRLKSKLREAGPDLWSVRTFVFELPLSLEEWLESVLRDHAAGDRDRTRGGFVDPALVESDVRRLSRALEGAALPTAAEAVSHHKLADRLRSVGRYDEAVEAWTKAVAAYRSLSTPRPGAPLLDLAKSLMGLADALYHEARHGDAERAYTEAIEILEAVHSTREHADVAAGLHGLANALEVQGRHDEAARAYQESIDIAERMQAGGDGPGVPAVRDYTAALAKRGGGDEGSIERMVDELARVVHDPDEARLIARRSGFPPGDIPSFNTPLVFWSRVVHDADAGKIAGGAQALIDEVARMYPGNAYFQTYRSH